MISALLLNLVSLTASPDAGVAVAAPLPVSVIWNWRSNAPRVRVWLEDDRTFRRGDRARVSFRTEEDAYVTVVRIDTDGRMRIIYPERPSYEHRVAGGRIYSVDGVSDGSFRIDDRAGMGYIFAIASWDRFDFERAYDSPFHQVGYRVRGDPYEAVSSLAEEMLPYRDALYSTHAAEYYVDNHRDYPRYSCNECHFGGSHPGHWHPHLHTCSYFRLVIFGGHHHHHYPDYYPYYYYHGHRRVYVRQHRYRPQYEFKEVARGERVSSNDRFIERRERQVAVDNRRPGSPLTDPNIDRRRPNGVTPGAGATRPGSSGGESATVGTMPGRRRGQEADGPGNSNNAPGRTGETPRRGAGNADDSPGNSGSAPGRAGTVPRRVEGTTNADPERDRGTTIEDGRPRRSEDPAAGDRRAPADDRRVDDGIERSSSDPRRDQPRRSDSESRVDRDDDSDDFRRDAPRREERSAEPRESRAEPRDEPRRAEPRSEPREERRAEPRSEPRSEPRRSEPKSEPRRSEPKRETRSEPKARSSESRGSSSRPSSSTPRRRD